jgi:hypothetical protein
MTTWSVKSGAYRETAERFLAGQAAPQPGVTLLGRWHAVDLSCGFSLYEVENVALLYAGAVKWTELLDFETVPVLEDAEVAPILAAQYGK